MPQIEIHGLGKIEVGEEFKNLNPDQQNAFVQNIASHAKNGVMDSSQLEAANQDRSVAGEIVRPALRATKSAAASVIGGTADLANLAFEAPIYAGYKATQYAKEKITGEPQNEPYKPIFAKSSVTDAIKNTVDEATGGLTANRNKYEKALEIPQEIAAGFVAPSSAVAAAKSVSSAAVGATKSAIKGVTGVKDNLIKDFADAGITPRLADVSTSKPTKAFQNLLEVFPGSASKIKSATENQINEISDNLAGLTKSQGGTIQQTGKTIQEGAKDFKGLVEKRVQGLYDDLDKHILAESQRQTNPKLMSAIDEWANLKDLEKHLTDSVQLNAKSYALNNAEAQKRLGFYRTNMRKEGAPLITMAGDEARSLANVKKQIGNQENIIKSYEKYMAPEQMQSLLMAGQQKIPTNNLAALTKDHQIQDIAAVGAGDTARLINRYSQIIDDGGNVSYPRLKSFRSTVGLKLQSPSLSGDERAGVKKIYGALSEDMKAAVVANGGEKGLQAFNKANNAFGRSQEFLEKSINPLIDAKTPEAVYNMALSGSKQGGSNIKPIMTSLNPAQKDYVRGTIVKRMGLQNAGLQDATGEVFSPNKFLTEWNKLSPEARSNIFTKEQAASIDKLNHAISSIKETSKIAQKSNNLPYASWLGLGLGILASPATVGQGAAAVGGARISAELMTNPKFINWLAQAPKVPAKEIPQHLKVLSKIAATNSALKPDIAEYLSSITQDQDNKNQITK